MFSEIVYFVSREQIQQNLLFSLKRLSEPHPEDIAKDLFENFKTHWTPVIWKCANLPITEEDLKKHIGLAPFHNKLKVIDGPLMCMNQVFTDDGTDVFDTLEKASIHAENIIASVAKEFHKFAVQFVWQAKVY